MTKKVTYFDTFASKGEDRIRNKPNHYLKISMMKNYLTNLKFSSLLAVILISVGWNVATAQNCAITGPTEVCEGIPASFSVTTAPGEVATWSTSSGQSANGGVAQFTHNSMQTVTITVTITAPGGGSCTQNLTLEVHDGPTASFILQSAPFQCYKGNMFCFKDNSTPGVNRTFSSGPAKAEFLFGDGAQDFTTGPGGTYCHSYPGASGGFQSPFLRIVNDKGCAADYLMTNGVYITEDIDANFKTNAKLACGKTIVPIQNTSRIAYNRVKKFFWDFGDGEIYESGLKGPGVDSCYWNPTHVYEKHGCFTVTLTVQDDSNCWDTKVISNFACNVNPKLDIEEFNKKDAQCQEGNIFVFTHNLTNPQNWPVNFIWVFDDPDSGPKNIDVFSFKNAPHEFTKPDVYTVTFQGTIAGCPFFGSVDVLTKGPAAAIDAKPVPDIVADTLRHQCQIKDTVYFKNNSKFAFNDIYILDDIAPGAASVLKEDNMVLVSATPSVLALEDVIDIYIWGKDTMAVIEQPLADSAAHYALIKHELVMFNNFFGAWGGERQDDHIRTVWDFADQFAPQCTTWTKYMQNVWDTSKPIYVFQEAGKPQNQRRLKESEMKYATNILLNVYRINGDTNDWFLVDTGYGWMNCNYSRDPKPKHWYTPGEEACYTVRLTLTDTSYLKKGQGYQYWDVTYFDSSSNERLWWDAVIDTVSYNTYKRGKVPDSSSVRYTPGGVFNSDTARFLEYVTLDSIFDYQPLMVGTDTVWNYSPYCAAEKISYKRNVTDSTGFFAGFDTTYNKWYINPNQFNGENCESMSTILLALEPPNALGMKVEPWKPGQLCLGNNFGVRFKWDETTPSCTRQHVWMNFDSLLDRLDGTPTILDRWTPQNNFLTQQSPPNAWPITTSGMPQWPNAIYYNYTGKMADSCGKITVGLRIQNGYDPYTKQPCIDERWYHEMIKYSESDPEFTLDTQYGCSPLEVELTFVRDYFDSLVALSINAQVDFALDEDMGKGFTYVDSIYRNKYDPLTGTYVNYIITYYFDRTGIPAKVDSFTWTPAEGGLSGCGTELKIKTKRKLTFYDPGRYKIVTSSSTKDLCTVTAETQYVVVGFDKQVKQNKTLICQDEFVQFTDSARYFLLEPDPITGYDYLDYNYWREVIDPPNPIHKNRNFNPDGSFRVPKPLPETTRWDFGQGTGFTRLQYNPIDVYFPVPGHYRIRAEFMDSIGCRDTMNMEVDVTGGRAHFGFKESVNLCKPIVNFFDSSKIYDPCRLTYGIACDSVIRWIWDYGDGSPITDTDIDNPNAPPIRNPSHVYPRFGDYDVKLIIQTRMGCWDTLVSTVSIAGPQPKFDFTIDSIGCVPYTVYLGNFTIDPTPNAVWTWNFGDPLNTSITTNSDTVMYFTYTTPGKYQITLLQGDTVSLTKEWCTALYPPSPKVVEVTVLPEKKVDFIPSKLEVCPNELVTFTDTSDTTYSTFIWNFDDGTIITKSEADGGRVVTHSFAQEGTYVVRLTPDYTPAPGEPKCKQSKAVVIIVRKVKASFTTDTTGMPLFRFKNTSTNGKEFWWKFEDDGDFIKCPAADPVNCPDAQHNYEDRQGCHTVQLVALSPEGCYDTADFVVCNTYRTFIKIPNVFTPDGDEINDFFKVEIEGYAKYEIKIYNRFSEKVFQSTDPNDPWNGKKNNTGADLAAGVYYVVINYQLRGQAEQTYNGTVTLIR